MFDIEKYLEKFTKEFRLIESNKEKIIEIIEKHTKLYILPKNIEIKEGIMYIKESPAVKNKLFIYKQTILEEISISTLIKLSDIR